MFKAEELHKIHFFKALTRMGKHPERIDFLVPKTAAQREVLLVPRIDFPSQTENLQSMTAAFSISTICFDKLIFQWRPHILTNVICIQLLNVYCFSRSLSIDDSPRLDDVPKPRPRHKTDIFGKTDQVDVDLETDSPSAHRFQRAGPGGRKTPTQVNSCKKLGKKMGFISIEIYISYGINNDIILTKYIVTFDVKKGEEPFWSKDENYNFLFTNFRLEEKLQQTWMAGRHLTIWMEGKHQQISHLQEEEGRKKRNMNQSKKRHLSLIFSQKILQKRRKRNLRGSCSSRIHRSPRRGRIASGTIS